MKKVKKWPYVVLVLLAVATSAALDRFKPDTGNSTQQQFSGVVIAIVAITLIVPYLAAWALGVMSWFSFSQLVQSGKNAKWPYTDGFRLIAMGIGLLVLDLIGYPLLGSLRDIFLYHHQPAMYLTIGSNLFHVLVPLLAFAVMYKGTNLLLSRSHYGSGFKDRLLPVLVPMAIFVTFFSLLVFRSPARQISFDPTRLPTYYLPDVLILLVVVVPLAITWALGLKVILNTERFLHSLPHDLRPPVVRFFYGLSAVISSAIIVQALTALGNQQMQEIGLALALVIVYLFVALQAVAYAFIYKSAQGLRKLIRKPSHETD